MAKILTDFEERAGLQAIEFATGQNYGESQFTNELQVYVPSAQMIREPTPKFL
jgi:hypothetical protein